MLEVPSRRESDAVSLRRSPRLCPGVHAAAQAADVDALSQMRCSGRGRGKRAARACVEARPRFGEAYCCWGGEFRACGKKHPSRPRGARLKTDAIYGHHSPAARNLLPTLRAIPNTQVLSLEVTRSHLEFCSCKCHAGTSWNT